MAMTAGTQSNSEGVQFTAMIGLGFGLLFVIIGCSADIVPTHVNSPLELVSSVQLGDVWAHEKKETVIRLRNRSSSAVRIEELTTGCDCGVASLSDPHLDPGEIADVRILLNGAEPRTSQESRSLTLHCQLGQVAQEFSFQFRRRSVVAMDNTSITLPKPIAPGDTFELEFAVDPEIVNDVSISCGDTRFQVVEQVARANDGNASARLTIAAFSAVPGGTCNLPLLIEASREGILLEATVYATVDVAVPASLVPAFVRIDTSRDTTVETQLSVRTEYPIRSVSMDGKNYVAAFTSKEIQTGEWILAWSAKSISGGGLAASICVVRIDCENDDPILISVPVSVYTPLE